MEVCKSEHELAVLPALIAIFFVALTTDVLECPRHVGLQTTWGLLGQFDSTLEHWHWEACGWIRCKPETVISVEHRRIQILFLE